MFLIIASVLLVVVGMMFQAKGFMQHIVKMCSIFTGMYGVFMLIIATAHAATRAIGMGV